MKKYTLLLLGCLSWALPGCRRPPDPLPPAPVAVVAAEVLVRDQPICLEYTAQALGDQDVEIRARVDGVLESVNFTAGSFVTSNTLLYVIDPRSLQAGLDQARGNLAKAGAALDKARRDVRRLQPLWEKNAISRQMLDDAQASEQSAQAGVDAAQAALEATQIQLGYARIYAPIDGLIGKSEVGAGNLVGQGQSTLLTTMSSIDPIHYRFSVSERDYLAWRKLHPDTQPLRSAASNSIELVLIDGSLYPHRGGVVFADRNIDPATGTLLLEVAYPNPDHLVRPGQFGRVRLPLQTLTGAVLVPQRAVQELQATYSVYVARQDHTAELRPVTLGPRVGRLQVIASGLQAGDVVVVEGWQKLRDKAPVAVTLHPIEPDPAPATE